jgi:D-alanyl-D-alanine carboxypeptidase/D-alanyl-D-alanine-endopeptidase (penicillin-binding protein 4)
MRPETTSIQVDAQVETRSDGPETNVTVRVVGAGRLAVRGHILKNSKPITHIHAVEDPAAFARALFIEVLRREGVEVEASALGSPRSELPDRDEYARMNRVAVLTSPPLSEVLKVTLKVSHNLYASTLPLLLAANNGERTLSEGMKVQQKRLSLLGVETGTISFGGGAGGERADMVSPRATVDLLLGMRKRLDYPVYLAALPILGVDGTLADVVEEKSPARGKVFAKTGTLGFQDRLNDRQLLQSKALAGYMKTARGRELAFAFFVNNVPLPRKTTPTREGKVLGKLCEIIYQHAP